ncbi:hypothetical protein NPX13_g8108 [Xylaria arbuscula]|uniref:Uncharacterized protein n=1 Tax=Xylaria arbuscula TaxID=114810 RepID=A0A9W8N9B8_9PEZI|nr:hypothetical protein NPX13_g8108 [Xylaria arbuscula]
MSSTQQLEDIFNMPSDDQNKDDSKVENHVNHDDKPEEEPQNDENATQDGNGHDVVPVSQLITSEDYSGKL